MKKRMQWIDISKGILTFIIVLLHIDYDFNVYFANFTGLFKVVVFFCIAGLTLSEKSLFDTKIFINNKFRKLYSKIIFTGLLAVALHNAFIKVSFYSTDIVYSGKNMKFYLLSDYIKQIFATIFLANREVIIGPLWYANVLFMALVGIAIINYICGKLVPNEKYKRLIRLILCTMCMLISWVLTDIIGFTIPRFNNTLTAIFLIDFCQFIYSYLKVQFVNLNMFFICLCILLLLPLFGSIEMNLNVFNNPLYLIVSAFVGMYVVFFIAKKLEKINLINKLFSDIGKFSFEIMALQFFSFKLGAIIVGVSPSGLTPKADNFLLVVYYFLFGIMCPIFIGRLIKKVIEIKKGGIKWKKYQS
ncbi:MULTISPECIES: hypothetical protein [Bacillota]|uniref:Acyltransferase 3 domain-containing protein n=2 Tax=Amedibacillus TaxID=2749846 RepID=A0A7G9GM65_9FIRM|nr:MULTISPECIES: hypothetical protein [Bacillota]QNM11897.1 hypothetical protein H9Q80_16870 [[Eubacterium] hominis]MCH4287634.1 hypothetical protein [Amedibacillus hominis]RGB48644.1 hypothetical protein DW271_20195 [Absiella sp. AM22-9]RGB62095.1 hypothetical protein DW113_20020 [Absiella sp. AM09-45]RGB62872.1 hypothetical protein DW120_03160 [Absiella sp. AM10-20]